MGRLNAPQSSSVKRENELCYGLTPFLKLELLIRVLAAPGYSNCARHARKVPNLKFLIKLLKSNLRFDPNEHVTQMNMLITFWITNVKNIDERARKLKV